MFDIPHFCSVSLRNLAFLCTSFCSNLEIESLFSRNQLDKWRANCLNLQFHLLRRQLQLEHELNSILQRRVSWRIHMNRNKLHLLELISLMLVWILSRVLSSHASGKYLFQHQLIPCIFCSEFFSVEECVYDRQVPTFKKKVLEPRCWQLQSRLHWGKLDS